MQSLVTQVTSTGWLGTRLGGYLLCWGVIGSPTCTLLLGVMAESNCCRYGGKSTNSKHAGSIDVIPGGADSSVVSPQIGTTGPSGCWQVKVWLQLYHGALGH